MNRIILIGNGFDLAHGLPTRYTDFLDYLWKDILSKVHQSKNKYSDDYIEFKYGREWVNLAADIAGYRLCSYKKFVSEFPEKIRRACTGERDNPSFKIVNKFLEDISTCSINDNWVDIENEYYKLLNQVPIDEYNIDKLNEEFELIKESLEEYLVKVLEKENIQYDRTIKDYIYSPIDIKDISGSSYKQNYLQELIEKVDKSVDESELRYRLKKISEANQSNTEFDDIKHFKHELKKREATFRGTGSIIENMADGSIRKRKYFEDLIHGKSMPDYFLMPNNILFLSFNYTSTVNLYYVDNDYFHKPIYVHGELGNKDNPIIFGYGDEIGEEYRNLENKNDNRFLQNIKSIQYSNTNNYKTILDFIESEPYQIFIMGHSCGNSDRTLLNKLFENQNCVSIKPYYYKPEKGNDNYMDIATNISRHFKDKASFREKLVSKVNCEIIPQRKMH